MSITHELPPADTAPFGVDPGLDPGDGETWDIVRLRCPECDRPIALLGDEERFPKHALLPMAWAPFSPAVCAGSGRPVDEADELEDEPDFDAEPSLEALLTLPPELDWRRQPFSHVGGPGSRPLGAPAVPAQAVPAQVVPAQVVPARIVRAPRG